MTRSLGPILVVAGLVLAVLGLLLWADWLGWFGRLPGDIRIERDGARVYVPLVSMLLVSIAVSLALYLVRRLF